MTNHTHTLKDKAFELAGEITLNLNQCKSPNEFIKTSLAALSEIKTHHDVVYAYVVDCQIMYIGESGESFATRFTRHINGVSQQGKKPIPSRVRWREMLNSGGKAQIYIHQCATSNYHSEEVSLRVGFESALITKFNPPLNSPRKAQKRKMVGPKSDN
jgi:hypothetical protein